MMSPSVKNLNENNGRLTFTLSGVNVSLANAIRRIIISEIPCVVFRTMPYIENKVNIMINTTRLNNELIKQRLSCIPIHISDTSTPIENYIIMIDKKNTSDTIEYVTTKDITIKDTSTGKLLTESVVRSIFPPDPMTEDYIDIARIRPQLSEDIDGEHLKLQATLDIGTAKENGSFNVACTCSYGNTEDTIQIADMLTGMETDMKARGMTIEEIEFKKKDWLLLDAQLHFIPDSFDFVIETVGQFTNMELVFKGVHVMIDKINNFKSIIQTEDIITISDTSLENGYDIKLISEDYTLGKALEYVLYNKHYDRDNANSDKILTFCGFRKPHPHIDESIIRLAFATSTGKSTVVQLMVDVCGELVATFENVAKFFATKDI